MSDWKERLNKSSADFLRLVWPAVGARFGDPIPVESVSESSFAKELDARAGIDVWLIGMDGHMRGLASRVQWTDRPYDTFTVRVRSPRGRPTEYHKRKAEIEAIVPAIRPYYFCHAYVSTDRTRLLSAAIARMSDVIAAVDNRVGRLMPANRDGSQGWAVPWDALRSAGSQVVVWPAGHLVLGDDDWPPVAQPGGMVA
jgi:hypothetical protein